MKNIIKKGPKFLRFKVGSFECGDYTLDINGQKYEVTLSEFEPDSIKDGKEPRFDSSNIHFHREIIPDENASHFTRLYPGQSAHNENYVPGINFGISIPAKHFATGVVKIYHKGEQINPDDVLTSDERYVIDEDKIHLGSIWNLTIDDDPRFQNTLIMVMRIWGSCIEFGYQTRVIYSPEYSHIEAAEGRIELYPRRDNDPELVNEHLRRVHLTLVKDNTNGGAVMDRQHDDEVVYPRSYSVGGYREQYPPVEFRKRIKRNPEEEYDENDDF